MILKGGGRTLQKGGEGFPSQEAGRPSRWGQPTPPRGGPASPLLWCLLDPSRVVWHILELQIISWCIFVVMSLFQCFLVQSLKTDKSPKLVEIVR